MFGDRISRRRQSAELGHQLPAPSASVHRLVGITPQRPRFDTVRAAVRLAFRAHMCGLVPASDANWLAYHRRSWAMFAALRAAGGSAHLVAMFDGSILVDRTRGEVAARCDSEAANVLGLNMVP